MTPEQAIAFANQIKRPQQRQPLDKLQGNRTAAAELSAGVTALAKRYSDLGDSLSKMKTRIDQLEADVEYLQTTFTPGSPIRRMHS
jgi:hypothetical protein